MNNIEIIHVLTGQEGIGDGAGLRLPETFHFLPQELGHFITRIVPKGIPDELMGMYQSNMMNLRDKDVTHFVLFNK